MRDAAMLSSRAIARGEASIGGDRRATRRPLFYMLVAVATIAFSWRAFATLPSGPTTGWPSSADRLPDEQERISPPRGGRRERRCRDHWPAWRSSPAA